MSSRIKPNNRHQAFKPNKDISRNPLPFRKTDSASFAQNSLVHIFLILVVGILAYSNTLHVPFALDDKSAIVENHLIKNLSGFFDHFAGVTYNPRRFMGYLTFALNYRLGGLDVTGYHLFNLAVHLVTSVLVYRFFLITFRTPWLRNSRLANAAPYISLVAALLFVSHPVQTQAVTYIGQRFASMATMFYLLSMTLYGEARLAQENMDKILNRKTILLLIGTVIAMLLAMTTKEIGFTLPVMLALYEFLFHPGNIRNRTIALLPLLSTVVILPLAMLNTHEPLGKLLSDINVKLNAAADISRVDYLLTQFCVVTTYVRLLFLPVNQNLDYAYPVYTSVLNPRVLGSFLFLAGLLATAAWLLIRARKGADPALRLISFGIFWFFIALTVESSVIPIADVIFEHRLYLPSVGAFITGVTALALVIGRNRTIAVTATLITVAILSVATWKRNQVWGDELTLWQDTVSKSPQKDRPHNNLGEAFKRKGRLAEAVKEIEIALALNPNSSEAHSNLGAAYLDRGEKAKALEHLQAAVKANPDNFAARYNLGLLYGQQGEPDRSAEQFQQALKLNPDHADAHNHLAVAYATQKMLDPAIEHFRQAVRLMPEKVEFRKNLELALQMKQTKGHP